MANILPQSYLANEQIKIEHSVDEDLKKFNFDYIKYQIDSTRVYEPILINYVESNSKDYMDLFYFYDPNNDFDFQTISLNVEVGNELNSMQNLMTTSWKLYYAGVSSDNTIKRYASYGYEDYRKDYEYRKYSFKDIISKGEFYTIENCYQFEKSSKFQNYSNCMNVLLGDPHSWSYNFDEDTELENDWESFLALFVGQDTLKNQLFYSFYIENWNVDEIKSVDMKYKKVLFDGVRAWMNDTSDESGLFMGQVPEKNRYRPSFYKWKESNSKDNYDKSNYLGSSLSEITSKVEYEKKTIVPEDKESVGVGHKYKWNSIQSESNFKKAFGENSDIYNFATNFFNNKDEKYWIINYDDFYYSYKYLDTISLNFKSFSYSDGHIWIVNNNGDKNRYFIDGMEDFEKFLMKNFIYIYSNPLDISNPVCKVDLYKVTQEYCFDIQMTSMTFEDTNKVIYELPVSVAPVDLESTGGDNENNLFDKLKEILDKIINFLKELWANLLNLGGFLGSIFQWINDNWYWLGWVILALILIKIFNWLFISKRKKEE